MTVLAGESFLYPLHKLSSPLAGGEQAHHMQAGPQASGQDQLPPMTNDILQLLQQARQARPQNGGIDQLTAQVGLAPALCAGLTSRQPPTHSLSACTSLPSACSFPGHSTGAMPNQV